MRARSCCLGAMAAAVGDTNGSANTRRRVKLYLLNDDAQHLPLPFHLLSTPILLGTRVQYKLHLSLLLYYVI